MRTITILVLVLPIACMLLAMTAGEAAFIFGIVWLVVSLACLAWGIYLRSRHRVLSWICIIYAVVQFGLQSLPFILAPRDGGQG